MDRVLERIEQANTLWLTQVLKESGALPSGAVTGIRVASHARPDSITANLALTYTASAPSTAPRRLFLKIGGRPKDVDLFRSIALPAPRCFHAARDGDRSHRLLLDLEETHYAPQRLIPPTLEQFGLMIDALADLHRETWESPVLAELAPVADGVDAFLWERAIAVWPNFVDAMGSRLPPSRRERFPKLAEQWRQPRPQVVTHGDAHAWNFMIRRDDREAILVDWEDWRVAAPGDDLAFLIAEFCVPEYRRRIELPLLERYVARLARSDFGLNDALDEYRRGIGMFLRMPVFWFGLDPEPGHWYPAHECAWAAYEDHS